MDLLPFELGPTQSHPTIDAWEADAPELVGRMLERWELEAGEPFVGGVAASVLAVTTREGEPAVLKVGFPHVEAIWEGVGLAAYPYGTAPRILAQDVWTWSLLLDAVAPGVALRDAGLPVVDALRIGGELHGRLAAAKIPPGVPHLKQAMRDYARSARARLASQADQLQELGALELVTRAIDDIESLAVRGPGDVLLHGDYNPGNILESAEHGWQVIDAKPLVGDSSFDLWPLVTQLGAPYDALDVAGALLGNLAIAADAAGTDATRAANWGFARTGLNVGWLLEDGEPELAAREAAALRAWAELAGR